MRRNLLVAGLVAAASVFALWSAGSALAGPGGSGGFEARIALVDLAHVFKSYKNFTNLTDKMKEDVLSREKQISQAQGDLKDLLNRRNQLNPESTTFKQTDAEIAKRKAELELMTDTARREFTQREANIYHATYKDVEAAIKQHADENQLTLVLRAARNPDSGPANPQDVIKEVSQQVIYSLPHMDITDKIVERLNRSSGPASPPAAPRQPNSVNTPAKKAPVNTGGNKGGAIKR